jgi:hypothetical protein
VRAPPASVCYVPRLDRPVEILRLARERAEHRTAQNPTSP